MKIGLLGPYGFGNLGDAAIQQAMIQNIRKNRPGSEIYGFSLNPKDTEERHGIPAFPISRLPGKADELLAKLPYRIRYNSLVNLLVRIFIRIPTEILLFLKSLVILDRFEYLIVSGGGQLDDYWGGAWGHPLTLFRWAISARLRGVKLAIVSVGAGPIDHPLSPFFIKTALMLAGFRSFRDVESKELIQRIGFKNDDSVYPDLAFSVKIPNKRAALPENNPSQPIVGIGPMAYFDPRVWPEKDIGIYTNYLEKVADFCTWLISRDTKVLLFPGEIIHDRRVIEDLKAILSRRSVEAKSWLIEPHIDTVDDLLNALAVTRFTVASRFHGVLLSMIMDRPVLALSYHPKIDALMDEVGLSDYCMPIDSFDTDTLIRQYDRMETNSHEIRARLKLKNEEHRKLLDEQYERLFG